MPAVVVHPAGSPSSSAAAAFVAARLASTLMAMLAQWCLTAWKDPIGLPNCTRSLAYAAVISRACSATPVASAAAATTPSASTRSSSVGGVGSRVAQQVVRGHWTPSKVTEKSPAGLVDHRNSLAAEARSRRVDQHDRRYIVSPAGGDHQEVGQVGVEHEPRHAFEHDVAPAPSRHVVVR